MIPFPPYQVYGDGSAYLAAFDSEAELAEEGMGEFLSTLCDYEDRLARGMRWQ